MAGNFFVREVNKERKRFNETFGRQTVCNLDARYSTILSICRMGILGNRISRAKDRTKPGESISEFIRIRDVINRFFNLMEKQEERKCDTLLEKIADTLTTKQRSLYEKTAQNRTLQKHAFS